MTVTESPGTEQPGTEPADVERADAEKAVVAEQPGTEKPDAGRAGEAAWADRWTRELRRERQGHFLRLNLAILFALGAVLLLLMPVDHRGEAAFASDDANLCGSVAFPEETEGRLADRCGTLRDQRLSLAFISLAGAGIVLAIGLAGESTRRFESRHGFS
ncbi:hypothetical protein GCM10009716_23510 [Streptomyces sodiiphilus]|uniref:Transmembrane protein n=1 Tax=Streptomyces sodiiphilus TaxID=226217 RepID=A0ABP5AGR1_9ACTN